jgi:hypothetical protein
MKQIAVLAERGEITAGVTETLGKDNDTTVVKISWLRQNENLKAYSSMMIYLTKGCDAQRLLSEGVSGQQLTDSYVAVY